MPLASRIVLLTGVVAPSVALMIGAYVAVLSLALPVHFV